MTNRKLDRISGAIFAALGILVAYGAWIMPRFEDRGASMFEAPGLTPGLLGVFLTLCGLALALRPADPEDDETGYWDAIAGNPSNRRRCFAALVLTLGYGAGLFGQLPFIPATSIFLFLFIVVFELLLPPSQTDSRKPAWQVLTIAAVIAIAFSAATNWFFVEIFLVQLP